MKQNPKDTPSNVEQDPKPASSGVAEVAQALLTNEQAIGNKVREVIEVRNDPKLKDIQADLAQLEWDPEYHTEDMWGPIRRKIEEYGWVKLPQETKKTFKMLFYRIYVQERVHRPSKQSLQELQTIWEKAYGMDTGELTEFFGKFETWIKKSELANAKSEVSVELLTLVIESVRIQLLKLHRRNTHYPKEKQILLSVLWTSGNRAPLWNIPIFTDQSDYNALFLLKLSLKQELQKKFMDESVYLEVNNVLEQTYTNMFRKGEIIDDENKIETFCKDVLTEITKNLLARPIPFP